MINIEKIIPIGNDERVKDKAINENGDYILLDDGKKNWQGRKSYGVNFAKIFYEIGVDEVKEAEKAVDAEFINKDGKVYVDSPVAKKYFSKSGRMVDCSCSLDYKIDIEGKKNLSNVYLCRDRLCPICMWRLSRRLSWETHQIVDQYTADNPNMVPIMIGLTVQNPKMGELSQMLDVLCHGKSAAWQLLQKWLSRRGIKDYIRTLEITFNCKSFTWHPHLHVLAFVPKEYFSKENKNYISHALLCEEWKRVCKLDYTPIVDIRRVYDKNSPKERIDINSDSKAVDLDLAGAIMETAKYCVKPLNLFSNYSDDGTEKNNIGEMDLKKIIRELAESLAGRRLRALGGQLKVIAKKLKLNDDEDKKDLLHNDESSTTEAVYKEIYEYVFSDKEYYLTSREIVEHNQKPVDKSENRYQVYKSDGDGYKDTG